MHNISERAKIETSRISFLLAGYKLNCFSRFHCRWYGVRSVWSRNSVPTIEPESNINIFSLCSKTRSDSAKSSDYSAIVWLVNSIHPEELCNQKWSQIALNIDIETRLETKENPIESHKRKTRKTLLLNCIIFQFLFWCLRRGSDSLTQCNFSVYFNENNFLSSDNWIFSNCSLCHASRFLEKQVQTCWRRACSFELEPNLSQSFLSFSCSYVLRNFFHFNFNPDYSLFKNNFSESFSYGIGNFFGSFFLQSFNDENHRMET